MTSRVDERLEPNKAIKASFGYLRSNLASLERFFGEQNIVPDDGFLRQLTILSYNTDASNLRYAIKFAAKENAIAIEKVRMSELFSVGKTGKIPLREAVRKKKFRNEASKYLKGIESWVEMAREVEARP